MKSIDKYTKAGTLSLHLQKHELAIREKEELKQINNQAVQEEQITVPVVVGTFKQSPKKYTRKSRSKDRHNQKSSSIRAPETTAPDLQDEEQLLQKCMNLTSRIQLLKRQKYEQAIQQFQEQQRKKLEYLFDKQKKLTSQKYSQKRSEIKMINQRESVRIAKGLEDTKKFKEVYNKILEDLSQKKQELLKEHQQAVQQIREVKERLISEWKRASNQQIIKKSNSFTK